MSSRKLIFVTNDDGYQSGGIKALVESLKGLGEIVVVAPDGARSGYSGAITSTTPLRFYPYKLEDDLKIYVCNGTPVDCVKLGVGEILKGRLPDLVVTGINHGSNAAVSVLYSGTMGAAMEGCLFGIPSVGFSLLDHAADADFSKAKELTRLLSEKVLEEGLPSGICLNVNIPNGKKIEGIRIGRQARGRWIEEFVSSSDGAGHPIFWLSGNFGNDEPEANDTDEYLLERNYVSVVPVKVDMTGHEVIEKLRHWEHLL